MPDFLIYGKIIIDDIRLGDGHIVRGVLGGGGPQAAFGARLWTAAIGFLSRSGADLEAEHAQTLAALQVDLAGWQRYVDIPTPRNLLITYNESGYVNTNRGDTLFTGINRGAWDRLLAQPLTLPAAYQQPRCIHLITEFFTEPMVATALALRQQGAIFSLEPIIDFRTWRNRDALLALLPQVEIVTPDWPSASGLAQSDEPSEVLRYWARLGPRLVAIRNGERGSYLWARDQDQLWHIPPVPVNVVDPTGAGNSYGGGLAVGWADTQDARLAGCYGAISAKFLVERVGLPPMSADLVTAAHNLLEPTLQRVRPL